MTYPISMRLECIKPDITPLITAACFQHIDLMQRGIFTNSALFSPGRAPTKQNKAEAMKWFSYSWAGETWLTDKHCGCTFPADINNDTYNFLPELEWHGHVCWGGRAARGRPGVTARGWLPGGEWPGAARETLLRPHGQPRAVSDAGACGRNETVTLAAFWLNGTGWLQLLNKKPSRTFCHVSQAYCVFLPVCSTVQSIYQASSAMIQLFMLEFEVNIIHTCQNSTS